MGQAIGRIEILPDPLALARLLKNLGLVIGRAKMNVFAVRAAELTQDRPELAAAVTRYSTPVRLSSGRSRIWTAR
jgi:hypothetical protein